MFKKVSSPTERISEFAETCLNIYNWENEKLSENEIISKLRHNKLLNIDDSKGNYSSNMLSPFLRFISGTVTAGFYAFDFYNSSISANNNKSKAKKAVFQDINRK